MIRRETPQLQIGGMKLDPTKTPKTVNVTIGQGPQKGDTYLGIYSLEGDTLRISLDLLSQSRPKDFDGGEGKLVMSCKRMIVKPDEPDLSGSYKSESIEIDGSKHIAEAVIERMGDAYLVTYKKGLGVAFIGVGIRKGEVFCMSWINQGQAGITMYQIEKNHRLIGQYTRIGGPGILSRETLTRQDFD
jgi:hypothetical protein